jgi:hypothetical protein
MMSQSEPPDAGKIVPLSELAERMRNSEYASADLVTATVAGASRRADVMGGTARSARINRLIQAGAWVDTALELLEGELPLWKLRRLTYDDGQWHCALSKQRELPEWLDQAVETSHADYALAILLGVVEAVRQNPAPQTTDVGIVPRLRVKRDELICCDNFA